MFAYQFEIMYKNGNQIWSQMLSQGKINMLRNYFVLFLSYNYIGSRGKG